jgi:FecR protein
MDKQGGELRALRQVAHELQNEPAPELDWDRVEQALLERTAHAEPIRAQSRWRGIALVAAAAAVAIAGLGVLHHVRSSAPAPVAHVVYVYGPQVSGALDGHRLAVGDRVVTGAEAVRVEHAGRVTWTLAPHSSATLAVNGRYLTIRLDSGSLSAEVVPSQRLENFAVEVEQTRIAVHGTHFTVQKLGDSARVVLMRGVVAVGPASERGHTQGWLMTAPATGTFSLDGAGTGHVDEGNATAPAEPAPAAQPTSASAPAAPPVAKEPARAPAPASTESKSAAPLPASPPQAELDRGADRVASTVRSCFAQNTEFGAGVRTLATTALSIQVAPAGNITTLHFDPPLAPSVQRCSASVMSSVHFSPSLQGATAKRTLKLER